MSLLIAAPTHAVETYDVSNQEAIQFNFAVSPDEFHASGTSLVLEVDGKEIILEGFFAEDGSPQVDLLETSGGDSFATTDFLAAILADNGGTAEDIETAADGATGSSGAGTYSDDPGALFNGLDALGGQQDSYDQNSPNVPDPTTEDVLDEAGSSIVYNSDDRWGLMWDNDTLYLEDLTNMGSGNGGLDATQDFALLFGQLRTHTEYVGTDGTDTLFLPDDDRGAALRLEDDTSFSNPGEPRVEGIEVFEGGSGHDVVDLSSQTMTYGDVSVYGHEGNDRIWTNAGDDYLNGGTGNDHLLGNAGNDTIDGGLGSDIIKGGWGEDLLNGGEGNDAIYGGLGSDTIDGGTGDDYINAGTGSHDIVTLGEGSDTIIIDNLSVTVNGEDNLLGIDKHFDYDDTASAVQVLDFDTAEDTLDLSGFAVLDADVTDDHTALLVGESSSANNTWVVLDGVDMTDLSHFTQFVDNCSDHHVIDKMVEAAQLAVATEV